MVSLDNNIAYLEKLIDQIQLEHLRRTLPLNHGEKVFPYERFDLLLNPDKLLKSAVR
jgi:hypothetical protein